MKVTQNKKDKKYTPPTVDTFFSDHYLIFDDDDITPDHLHLHLRSPPMIRFDSIFLFCQCVVPDLRNEELSIYIYNTKILFVVLYSIYYIVICVGSCTC